MENKGLRYRIVLKWKDGGTLADYHTNEYVISNDCISMLDHVHSITGAATYLIFPLHTIREILVTVYKEGT